MLLLLFLFLGPEESLLQVLARLPVLRVEGDRFAESGGRLPEGAAAEQGVAQVVEGVPPGHALRAAGERRPVPAYGFGEGALPLRRRGGPRPRNGRGAGGRGAGFAHPVMHAGEVQVVLRGSGGGVPGAGEGPQGFLQPSRFEMLRPLAGVALHAAEGLGRRGGERQGEDEPGHAAVSRTAGGAGRSRRTPAGSTP